MKAGSAALLGGGAGSSGGSSSSVASGTVLTRGKGATLRTSRRVRYAVVVGGALLLALLYLRIRTSARGGAACPGLIIGHHSPSPKGPDSVRILISTGAYNNIVDGVTSTLNTAVAALEQRGYDVLVIAPALPPEQAVRAHMGLLLPAAAIHAPMRPEYLLATGLDRCNKEALDAFDPQLVHIATPDLLGDQVMKWSAQHNVPVVCSYHTRFNAYLPYYVHRHLLPAIDQVLWVYGRYFYNQCDHIYPPTASVRTELIAKGVGSLDKHRIWPRGIDLSRFNTTHRSEELRREWGASADTPVLLFVSRLVPEKNTRVFTETVRALRASGEQFVPVVVGEGPGRAQMEVDIPGGVFLGFQGGEGLSRAFASGDIFFFPSESETWGAVTLEAMASGLAVVVANAPGSTDLVRHGETGLIVEAQDLKNTTASVQRLLRDVPLRRRLAAQALSTATHNELTWESATDKLVGYYDEALRDFHTKIISKAEA